MAGVNMNHFDAQAHVLTGIQNKMENSVWSGFTVLKLDNPLLSAFQVFLPKFVSSKRSLSNLLP